MGELHILFEITDPDFYSTLESLDILMPEHRYDSPVGVSRRRFKDMLEEITFLGHCFVSPNYQAHYGDFTDHTNPVKLEESFGPTSSFYMGLNTGSRNELEEKLRTTFQKLEQYMPRARENLSYVGIFYRDHDLICKDEEKERIEAVLHQ